MRRTSLAVLAATTLVAPSPALAQEQGPLTRVIADTTSGPFSRVDELRDAQRRRDLRRTVRLAEEVARERGEPRTRAERLALHRRSIAGLARHRRHLRRVLRELRAAKAVSPQLQAIAACESGGDPRAIGGGGAFRGKYQFTPSTWASVGGSGDPAAAPEAEQDRRAAMLLARDGAGHWPVCGAG